MTLLKIEKNWIISYLREQIEINFDEAIHPKTSEVRAGHLRVRNNHITRIVRNL